MKLPLTFLFLALALHEVFVGAMPSSVDEGEMMAAKFKEIRKKITDASLLYEAAMNVTTNEHLDRFKVDKVKFKRFKEIIGDLKRPKSNSTENSLETRSAPESEEEPIDNEN